MAQPLILQVPITVKNGKAEIGKPMFTKETPAGAQKLAAAQLSSAKNQLANLRGKLKPAEAAYKANPSPPNFKIVESIKAEIARMAGATKKAQAKLSASSKDMISGLRKKIKNLKSRLKTTKGKGAQKVLGDRLAVTINRFYDLRIQNVSGLIAKNRSNVSAMRRNITANKNIVASIIAQEARNTIPNPVMKVRRLKASKKLRQARSDLVKADVRYKFLTKKLNMIKAAKNRFNAKRGLVAAVAGAASKFSGSINKIEGKFSGSINKLRQLVMRHDRMLRKLAGKKTKKCPSLNLQRLKLNAALGRLAKLTNSLKKTPTNKKLKEDMRRTRIRIARLREKVAAAVKCRGMIICGDLKKAYRNLANAKVGYEKVMETARNRPSDEDSQKARITYTNRMKKHRNMIKSIWKCICNRAQKKYRQYKDLYERKKSPVYRRRMLLHKEMLRKCNCRAANINFSRASKSFITYRNRFQSNPMDQTAKEKMESFYKSVLVHYARLKLYKCKLPPLPRKIESLGAKVVKKTTRRRR
jgi:hypothetical protein